MLVSDEVYFQQLDSLHGKEYGDYCRKRHYNFINRIDEDIPHPFAYLRDINDEGYSKNPYLEEAKEMLKNKSFSLTVECSKEGMKISHSTPIYREDHNGKYQIGQTVHKTISLIYGYK